MASVKSGRAKARPARRRKAAGRRARRVPFVLAVAALGVVIGAGAFGLRSSASEAIAGFANAAVDAGFRKLGLTVQDVTVSGRRNAPSGEILAALRVDRGASIMSFDASRARARVLDVDWVQDAAVKRLFPDTIEVTVSERKPFAVWRRKGRNFVVDAKGETITVASPAVMEQLPYLAGEGAPAAAPKLFAMLEGRPSIKTKLRQALRVGQRRWTLRLEGGIDVLLPASGVELALDELVRLSDVTDLLGRDIRIVDLRLPDRLTVRARKPAKSSDSGDKNT
ncbi:hypothetical protein MNBD_ALPHA09-1432 [hydrothermal vent metagenome]|uniref:POTRA domain-containing protein n=1 Tax=hydrothermal vent metagenome TaxID=652676 RepID=A0A3B0TC65_9ZZZZ